MSETPKRASGIPRPSKLPIRPSGLPKPTATPPRPSSTIRPSASRDSLSSSTFGTRDTVGDVRSRTPGLKSSVSRDQLRSSVNLGRSGLRTSASRDQLVSGRASRASISKPSHPPVSSIAETQTPSKPHRRRVSNAPSETPADPELETPAPTETNPPETDQVLFKRRLTLTRRPSESFGAPPFPEAVDNVAEATVSEATGGYEPVQVSPLKTKPSLSERTMETLANIPSSPALKKKTSAFFDQGRPASRSSRPGSSYNSDSSGRQSSRAEMRPGSSMGSDLARGSNSGFKETLSTIDGTPQGRSSAGQAVKTPVVRKTASRPSLTSVSKLQSRNMATPGDNRSPSPVKKNYGALPPKSASKTVGSRPSKPRASVGGLFKKPSLPAINSSAANGGIRNPSLDSAQSSNTSSWDGAIPSNTSTRSTSTAPTDVTGSPESTSRKSSSALREQIAKAKAAKRAAIRSSMANEQSVDGETPIVPSDDGFDFGVGHDDPFGLRKGENAGKKILEQKVNIARSTGRLNIAALNLKEMPVEVMKMYDLESLGTHDGSWAESVDLTRLIAADNELEKLDDFIFPDTDPNNFNDDEAAQGNIFGGLETIDLHGNLLVDVPLGFRRLGCLTSLNLSSNRLSNNSIDTIAQVTSLRDLKLAKNLFYGPLNADLSNLSSLEILDLHGNNISALPPHVDRMSRLRILNLSENSFESLPFSDLAKLPLTELALRKNKLSGALIDEPVESMPELQTLDASSNQLTQLVPLGSAISFPVLHALSLSMNRLQGLPDMTTWSSLLTLTVDENNISGIPNSFTTLEKLRHADFSSNDIRVVPPEISRMDNLTMIRLSGNPLRDKKFVSITTEELKDILAGRLEPPPPYQEAGSGVEGAIPGFLADAKAQMQNRDDGPHDGAYDSRSDMDEFATPPTSAPQSPARSRSETVSSLRSRSATLSNQTWPVKQGGILDRSRTESSSLHPVVCSKVAAENRVKQVMLHHNLFPSIPNSLSFFAESMTILSLAHNQLVGETYLEETIEFPALRELNLSSNRITGLEPLIKHLHAPVMEKLDVSMNRVNSLPTNLKEMFPALTVLLASNNQIPDLEPEMIQGIKIVDASSNDISRLNPKIGLLGGSGGLERLDVMGNRFRVPRYNVLERGTEATLRWLRGRVPVAEMAAWRNDNGEGDDGSDDVD